MTLLWQDVRFAARSLAKSPVFACVAILSLAIGIGAAASVFSIVDAFFIRTLRVRDADQLVFLRIQMPPARTRDDFPSELFTRLRRETSSFSAMAAVNILDRSNISISGASVAADAARVRVALVSGDYFSLFGVNAAHGRLLNEDDDRVEGAHPVAVISNHYWRTRLGAAPDVLERTLSLNGSRFTIVGVAPADFTAEWVGRPVDIWFPAMMQSQVMFEEPGLITHRNAYWLRVLARVNVGVTPSQAAAEAQTVYHRVLVDWSAPAPLPADVATQRVTAVPLGRGYSPQRETLARPILILSIVVGLGLLVACANVASLLLARAHARQREMAIRLAVGAGRWRLARQVLTESVVVSFAASVLAIGAAIWGSAALARSMGRAPVEMFWAMSSWTSFDFHVDARVLLFTGGACLVAGVALGIAPAIAAPRVALASSLTARSSSGRGSATRFTFGKTLVVVQVALSLTVLIFAGLLVRTIRNLGTAELGFSRERLLLVWTQPSATSRGGAGIRQVWRDVQQKLETVPGVVSASALNSAVLSGTAPAPRPHGDGFMVPGQPPRPSTYPASRTFILPRLFQTLGVPLVRGREFNDSDLDSTRSPIIISETMARHYFDDRDPIGRRIGLSGDSVARYEIVGVVRDFERGTPRAVGQPRLLWYLPYTDNHAGGNLVIMCVVVRVAGGVESMTGPIRNALREAAPALPVFSINTVDDQLADILAPDRLVTALTAIAGAIAVLLACLGLYGVIAYTTSRRTNEIGIRMSLGATRGSVLGMVLAESGWLIGVGIVAGVGLAVGVTRLVQARLYSVGPTDPLTFAGAATLMLLVGAIAAFVPARRAAAVDPVVALRHE